MPRCGSSHRIFLATRALNRVLSTCSRAADLEKPNADLGTRLGRDMRGLRGVPTVNPRILFIKPRIQWFSAHGRPNTLRGRGDRVCLRCAAAPRADGRGTRVRGLGSRVQSAADLEESSADLGT
jgi:hypothetical protein